MALENATTINQLNPLFPVATDGLSQADDHMRLIKSSIQNTFPNVTGAITATQNEINVLDGVTATTNELNILDGVTATYGELNALDGIIIGATQLNMLFNISSNVQGQLNDKQPTITGAATTIDSSNLTANRALVSDSSGKVAASSTITTTELGYLNGVSSNIQTQINTATSDISTLTSSLNSVDTDLVNDTSPQLGGDLDTNGNAVAFGSWTIEIDGSNNLLFKYAGNTKIRLTSAGALDVEDDITAYSGI